MTDFPDCSCGGPVVLEIDHDGAAEVCVKCGATYWPRPPVGWQQNIRRRVQALRRMTPDERQHLKRPGDTVNTREVL